MISLVRRSISDGWYANIFLNINTCFLCVFFFFWFILVFVWNLQMNESNPQVIVGYKPLTKRKLAKRSNLLYTIICWMLQKTIAPKNQESATNTIKINTEDELRMNGEWKTKFNVKATASNKYFRIVFFSISWMNTKRTYKRKEMKEYSSK